MKSASERFNEHFERDYTRGVQQSEFVPLVLSKQYLEAYAKSHQYHTMPSLYGYQVK
jgi:hypothetical protein